jgi:hypothetical protein
MGRTLTPGRRGTDQGKIHGQLVKGFDSHFDDGFEAIVYDPAQILPCYVVHLDMGPETAINAMAEAQASPATFRDAQKRNKIHHRLLTPQPPAPRDAERLKAAK